MHRETIDAIPELIERGIGGQKMERKIMAWELAMLCGLPVCSFYGDCCLKDPFKGRDGEFSPCTSLDDMMLVEGYIASRGLHEQYTDRIFKMWDGKVPFRFWLMNCPPNDRVSAALDVLVAHKGIDVKEPDAAENPLIIDDIIAHRLAQTIQHFKIGNTFEVWVQHVSRIAPDFKPQGAFVSIQPLNEALEKWPDTEPLRLELSWPNFVALIRNSDAFEREVKGGPGKTA